MKVILPRKILLALLLAAPAVVSVLVIGFRHVTGLPAFGIIFNLVICGFLFALILRRMAQRDRAEKTLRESEDRFRQLVQHAGDIIYRTDRLGHFTFVNQTIEQLMGYQPEEMLGHHFLEPVAAAARAEVGEFYRQQFATVTPVTFHYFPAVRKDGSEIWIAQTVQLVIKDGRLVGAEGVARDATLRVQLQQELARARDAALESARAKSEFVAHTSHEIRTPMHSIMGMATILAETALDSEQRHFVDNIRQSANGLLGLVNDVLDFSKIESGRLLIEARNFDLAIMVQGIVDLFAEVAESKNVALTSVIAADVPAFVHADSMRLRQILINLVGNALKFTHEGEVALSVQCLSQTDTGVGLRFEVTDTGIGISDSAQQQLFNAFVQADGSTARNFGGTGLGLAISKQLVEAMDGDIGIVSRVGKGSTFWFTVSVGTVLESVEQTTLPPADVDNAERNQTFDRIYGVKNSRLLVVEDHPINQEIARYQLEKMGYSVDVAGESRAALALLDAHEYALILMDCHLPDVDGFETTARIRRRGDHKRSVPIIAVTASISPRNREQVIQSGMNDMLLKPFHRQELAAKIERWISNAPHSSASSSNVLSNGSVVSNDVENGLKQLEEDYGYEMVRKIVDMFIPDTEARITKITLAVRREDYAGLEEAAHGLKSGTANVGALEMTALCERLEMLGESRSIEGAEVIVTRLTESWNNVRTVLLGWANTASHSA